jgi:hypothetical protein
LALRHHPARTKRAQRPRFLQQCTFPRLISSSMPRVSGQPGPEPARVGNSARWGPHTFCQHPHFLEASVDGWEGLTRASSFFVMDVKIGPPAVLLLSEDDALGLAGKPKIAPRSTIGQCRCRACRLLRSDPIYRRLAWPGSLGEIRRLGGRVGNCAVVAVILLLILRTCRPMPREPRAATETTPKTFILQCRTRGLCLECMSQLAEHQAAAFDLAS